MSGPVTRFPDFSPTVPELLRDAVYHYADSELIVHGDQRLSYGDLDRRSADLAKGLLAGGIGKGSRVALWMPNGPDWLVAWSAATRIGAWVVPLNTFYRPRELAWALHHSDAQCLLTASRFLKNDHLAMLEEAMPSLSSQESDGLRIATHPYLRKIYAWGGEDRPWCLRAPDSIEAAGRADPAIDQAFLREIEGCVSPADPLVTIYTSGSTADPKGAIHTHGAMIRHACNLNQFRGLTARDRLYSPMPFFWVGGLVVSLLSMMQVGGCLLSEDSFQAGATLDLLERERATVVVGWAHYAKAMAEHPSFPERDLSAIRAGNLYQILPDAVRPADPELRSNSLGMTETCGPHTFDCMEIDLPERLRGSFGHAVPGVEHKIVDPETGAILPPGEFGEICVRGYSLMQGLYKVERKATFDAEGFYHTGDGGYFDEDGVLYFKSRLGEMIKTGGANVTPREVEAALEGMSAIREAYVLGMPDADRGEIVVAVIVPESGQDVSAEELRADLKARLSAYKVPREFHYSTREALPFTDSGKIDKRALIGLIESWRTG